MYLEVEDHEELFDSIKNYDNIDSITLARNTENHELLEFRRIASFLYRK